ncbi:MAG TPA: hypothetical protein VGR78_01880 [Verrucomicrobiae bacterium]|nr:hypothetical protein [Verrucomicrobiae bacterium]
MKRIRSIKIIIALSAAAVLAASLHAQDNHEKPGKTAALAPEPRPFEIEFPGGTPDELVQDIANHSGIRPNVIIPSQLEKIELPKFKLQNVNAGQVFEALNMVVDQSGAQTFRWISQGPKDDPRTVWTLAKAPTRLAAEMCQVWFIGNLLESSNLEDINTAISAAWQMLEPKSSPALKFHKETSLLIARGTDQELKLVGDVLRSLELRASFKKTAESKKVL